MTYTMKRMTPTRVSCRTTAASSCSLARGLFICAVSMTSPFFLEVVDHGELSAQILAGSNAFICRPHVHDLEGYLKPGVERVVHIAEEHLVGRAWVLARVGIGHQIASVRTVDSIAEVERPPFRRRKRRRHPAAFV